MNVEQKLQELRESQNQISNLKKEVVEKSSTILEEFSKGIFLKYPKLESFGWSQYTPYFNDGETCVFQANIDYLSINGENAEESDWYSENKVLSWGTYDRVNRTYVGRVEEPNQKYNKELVEACEEIRDFLSNFDNDFYLSKYGDHAEITITPLGVNVDECEHD